MNLQPNTTETSISHHRPNYTTPTINQIRQLIRSAYTNPLDLQVCTVLSLVATTGIRPRELCKARWSDVNFDQRTIFVSSEGRSRLVHFWPKALALLQLMQAREGESGNLLGSSPEWVIVRVSNSLRSMSEKSCGASFFFHQLRRFFCSVWADLGGDIESLCRVAGYPGNTSRSE